MYKIRCITYCAGSRGVRRNREIAQDQGRSEGGGQQDHFSPGLRPTLALMGPQKFLMIFFCFYFAYSKILELFYYKIEGPTKTNFQGPAKSRGGGTSQDWPLLERMYVCNACNACTEYKSLSSASSFSYETAKLFWIIFFSS